MRLFDRHRRLRAQLSAYLDGGLDAAAARRLEAHLAGCESCPAELAQLRATVAALRDLPQAEVPRSFALSTEQAPATRPAAGVVPPLAFASRLAAVTVAAALAAVLVVDIGDFGREGAPNGAPGAEMAGQLQDEATGRSMDAPAGGAMPEATAVPPEAYADGGGEELRPDAAATQTAAQQVEPDRAPADTAEAPAAGGLDALTAAEIGLAAALAALVAAGVALAFAGRQR